MASGFISISSHQNLQRILLNMKGKLLFAVVIGCNLLLCYFLFFKKRQMENCVKVELFLRDSIETLNSENLKMIEHMSLVYEHEDFNQMDNIVLKNEKGEQEPLMDMASSGCRLIFRLQKGNCLLCIKEFNEVLGKHSQNNVQVAYVIDSGISENLEFYKTYLGLDGSIYVAEKVNEQIDNENRPYIFLLNKDLSVDYLYFPMYGVPVIASQYVEKVISKR